MSRFPGDRFYRQEQPFPISGERVSDSIGESSLVASVFSRVYRSIRYSREQVRMPTPIGHILFSTGVFIAYSRRVPTRADLPVVAGFAVLSLLPDIDFAPMIVQGFKAVSLYHQAYTHNLGFCLASAVIITMGGMAIRGAVFLGYFPLIFSLIFSHVLIDAMGLDTNPPFGVQLLWPFYDGHILFPISLFIGAAKGSFSEMFSWWNGLAILIELAVFLPFLIVLIRHYHQHESSDPEVTHA